MIARRFRFTPLDTLFFRDGRPFNQDDEGLADARSLFPPYPSVLTGALRAAVARAKGWGGTGSWRRLPAADDPEGRTIVAILGDGANLKGARDLAFGPPVLLRREGSGWQRLYPAPLHLVGKKTRTCWALTLLRPDETRPLACDLHSLPVALPVPDAAVSGGRPLTRHWLTPSGLRAILKGSPPSPADVVELHPEHAAARRAEGWQQEFRVGLAREASTRTAVPGQLYAASHVRLGRAMALGLEVAGLPHGWSPEPHATVGGLQRLAEIEEDAREWEVGSSVLPVPDRAGALRYVVVLPAPAQPEGDGWRKPGAALDSRLPGRIVAACIDRPVMIGGWDGRDRHGGKWGPRPLVACRPAGSVWFMRAGPEEADEARARLEKFVGRPAIGDDQSIRQGFGECLIGRWPAGGH